MHIYIYDSYLSEKKYQHIIAQIETRITDLGLNGKIIRIGMMNSVYSSIENEIKKGAKTIIAVGGNILLNHIINSVAKLNTTINNINIPIGFIPIDKNNIVSDYLGLDYGVNACDILSARRVQLLDLGQINNHFFLFNTSITTKETTIEIDKNYSIEILKAGEISVVNIPFLNTPKEIKSSAKDGALELLITTHNKFNFSQSPKPSVFSFNKLKLLNNSKPVVADYSIEIPTPVTISIATQKINFIVGKNRKF